jgi:hypothetical protein
VLVTPPAGQIEVPIASLADGCHEIRLTAVVGDPIETQSTAVVPFVVDSRGFSMEVAASPKSVTLDEWITLRVKMPRAKRIVLLHNRREVASIAGPEGSLRVAAATLGLGRVRLQPVAFLEDDHVVASLRDAQPPSRRDGATWGPPLEVTVTPPKPLPAIKDRPQQLAAGLALSAAGGPSVVVEQTRGGDWLAKTVKPGQDFVLEGYFDVPAEDMYQFQVRSSIPTELAVDGQVIQPSGPGPGRSPQYFPVSLAPGLHRVTIKGRAAEKSTMELYFGGPGATSVGADRFRHVKPAGTHK